MQRGTAAPSTSSDTQPDEPKRTVPKRLGEQRADVWAFGCLLTSLAQHHRSAPKSFSQRQRRMHHQDGAAPRWRLRGGVRRMACTEWRSTRVCRRTAAGAKRSPLRHAAEAEAAEDRPYTARTPGARTSGSKQWASLRATYKDLKLSSVWHLALRSRRAQFQRARGRRATALGTALASDVPGSECRKRPDARSTKPHPLLAREALQPGQATTTGCLRPEQSHMPQPLPMPVGRRWRHTSAGAAYIRRGSARSIYAYAYGLRADAAPVPGQGLAARRRYALVLPQAAAAARRGHRLCSRCRISSRSR